MAKVDTDLAMLQDAEDSYYMTATYLVELAQRAYDIFVSSKAEERRQLMTLVLSNLRVEDKFVRYDVINPYNTILKYADRQAWLRTLNEIRTFFSENPNAEF